MGLILTLLGGIVLTLGDIIMKKWILLDKWYLLVSGLFVWLLGNSFLAFSFKYTNIAIASLWLVLFNVISLLLVSYFYFGEKLSTIQIVGIILGLISAAILEYF